ncbi:MAG: hypothetical protein ABI944_01400, partial [Chthoniobacterales bacterium]
MPTLFAENETVPWSFKLKSLKRLWDFYLSSGSEPVRPAPAGRAAHVAQLVEHVLGKDEVTG